MNHSIRSRRRSLLDTKDWLTLPWQHFPKDCFQKVLDVGFKLAALMEQVDLYTGAGNAKASTSDLQHLSLSCSRIFEELEDWYTTFWTCDEHSLHESTEEDIDSCPLHHPGSPPQFGGLWEATNIMYYWWFKLLLNEVMASLFQDTSQQERIAKSGLELATNMVLAAPYLVADDTGWLGPQRLFFPLQRAMGVLAKVQSPFFADAEAALARLGARLRPC